MSRQYTTGQRSMIGTAMSGRPPPSRMKTGYMPGTSAGQQAAFLPSREINVSNRSITAAGGIAGTRVSPKETGFPEGKVYDEKYFIRYLRSKETAIIKETQRLRTETEKLASESDQHGKLEWAYEEALHEVGDLDRKLEDYNTTYEEIRSGTAPDEVGRRHKEVSVSNRVLKTEVDEIFLAIQQRENDIIRLEKEKKQIHISSIKIVQSMEPENRQLYHELSNQLDDLHREGRQHVHDREQLMRHIIEREGSIRVNRFMQEYKKEEQHVKQLQAKLSGFREELLLLEMDPNEAHEFLQNKMKKDQEKMADVKKRAFHIEREIERLSRIEQDLRTEMSRFDDADSEKKYKYLFQKYQGMVSFLDTYAETVAKMSAEQTRTKSTIVALLEHISADIAASEEELPSLERLEELKEDVDFKARQLETSKETMVRLLDQKRIRVQELEKINNLEGRITLELQQLKEKMENMDAEIIRFGDLLGLEKQAETTKNYLMRMSEQYTRRTDFMRKQVKMVEAELEDDKEQLEFNDTWKALCSLEQQLCDQGQIVFELQEFVETRGRQTDFETIKKQCFQIVETLNEMAKHTAY